MIARDNSIFPNILKEIDNTEDALIIYSMWEGYLTDKFRKYCEAKKLRIAKVHTSGHAIVDDLQLFAKAMNPKVLVPIHTFEGNQYPEIFENVKILKDGEIFGV
jgi:ribonuclease J